MTGKEVRACQAAVLHAPGDVRLEERPVRDLAPDEALVQVMAVGVCGSDVHYYEHGRIGDFVVRQPLILGHECAGVVVATGAAVTRVKPGDRVAIEPGVTCGRCPACKSGRYNLCPEVQFLATPPVDGAFAEYIVHREDFLHPIPDGMSFEAAALVEPFSVGLHACARAGVRPGDTVAILGMGPVGLLAVVAAAAYGAQRIIVSDLEENRLAAARRLGATDTVPAAAGAEAILALTGGQGVDVALETAGHPKALATAMAVLRRGGRLAVVGLPPQDEVALHIPRLSAYEIDVLGVFRYANTYPRGIALLASGRWPIEDLVTDRYPLAETKQALERARTNKAGSIKVMVYPQA
ncbi:sorbitol dehydrogenase [Alicyclobacillus cellulosilyticus]|uniref:Sorbitol dehydrogenase n=1 Tax=Alicyclobacillus cellulosilyticus TaxID=1003997 RepID=A0A917KC17_9BACL|nr:NAD(P)-dependent alcohol dehydrogenase [Alicyclobacillus cellulosilyticus]GGJ08689.1 sorbitol dehydrogenase [Alicyclobacillus cellulosilyticus]